MESPTNNKKVNTMIKKLLIISSVMLSSTVWGNRHADITYAEVVDVQPVYRTISVPERRENCERVPREIRHRNHGGAVLGGIIGGAIGNRFGGGRGRDASTALGLIIGAGIGSNHDRRNSRYERRMETHCYTDTIYRDEQQLDGYDVSYIYDGRIHHTMTRHHPGDRIKIRVKVDVIE